MTKMDLIAAFCVLLAFMMKRQRLTARALPRVACFLIRPVVCLSDVGFPFLRLFDVISTVFDHGLDLFLLQISVVLLSAISGIGK